MSYPLSSEVSSGQPTASTHYNNLRRDALRLGQDDADSVHLAQFLARYISGVTFELLSSTRIRIPFVSTDPPTIMINGHMLQAAANVDLASGLISGSAAVWYIFAVRTDGSTTFTISANTSSTETTDQRLIGEVYWSGTAITNFKCYFGNATLPEAGYDSGWFAVSYSATYSKTHGLGTQPRLIVIFHSSDAAGASEWVLAYTVYEAHGIGCVGATSTEINITTGVNSSIGVIYSTRRQSPSGYYRVFAWA